jgi:hypothetical protein
MLFPLGNPRDESLTSKVAAFHPQTPGCFCPRTDINNFLPAPTDSFTLMTFSSSVGAFANAPDGAVVRTAGGQRQFTVRYLGNSLVLTNAQPASFALTSIVRGGSQVIVRFESSPATTYEVQYSSTLTNWIVVSNAVFTAPAPGITQWIDDGTLTAGLGPIRFYRLRQHP